MLKKIIADWFSWRGEFFLIFLYMANINWLIQQFSPNAQADFSLGSRVM